MEGFFWFFGTKHDENRKSQINSVLPKNKRPSSEENPKKNPPTGPYIPLDLP